MKLLVAIALVAAAWPGLAVAAGRPETATNERRVCTQITARAGSRMSGRRVCRTSREWRDALGPDWRQHLNGATSVQDTMEQVEMRTRHESNPPVAPN
ncbi:MAG TPA: hypothetical protein VEC11_05380 [Allosphingosinicella sp.]|nr:hypothetical protein [Allosphingosinicella sp.]